MHGCGNDFVVIDCISEKLYENLKDFSRKVCNRRFGIGADTLVLLWPSKIADVRLRFFNSDGSEAEMCGNAVRCASEYIFNHGILAKKEEIIIETLAGCMISKIIVENGKVLGTVVDMGEPKLKKEEIPLQIKDDPETVLAEDAVIVEGKAYHFAAVSMGNPHCIIYVPDVDKVELHVLGPKIEKNPIFPNGTNVEFVEISNDKKLKARIWERGGEEALACGTGACAIVVAGFLKGLNQREATVHYKGGDIKAFWSPVDNHVYMTGGPTVEVFSGDLVLDSLRN